MLRTTWLTLLACCCLAGAASGEEAIKIGVFDQRATGGQGASVDGIVRGLEQLGYATERIADLDALTLAECDVVYLSDMHSPGNVHQDWRKNLGAFVRAGGSVLQTWHHHVLGEVGHGVKRVYGSQRMHVEAGHPAVEGVTDFDSRYEDHIVERVGPAGTVILTNDDGEPVAAAGSLGRGKVISTGLALAIPSGRASTAPRGMEVPLLRAFLAWLAPEVPRGERIAEVLQTPQLYVSPPRRLAAAGFDAVFQARVGYREAVDVEVECPDAPATIEPLPAPGTGHPGVRSFVLTIATEPGKSVRRDVTVRARVGARVLEQKVEIDAVYGEPPEKEVRGVWLHVGSDRHPKTVMPELARLGINMAVLRIAGGTAAFYASRVQPDVQDPLAPEGDWLAEAVRHAHAHGIEIHPYVNNCVVEGRTSPESLARLRAAGRLQQGPDGRPIDWFCPSQDVNFEAMEAPMLELATRYDVDGVQYDFIRYPSVAGCFCPKCRALFEQETGKAVAKWPADVAQGGSRHKGWVEFRCRRISGLVERISAAVRKAAPKVKISAAVFRDWPRCRETNGQDWVRWCREGWLDFVCPMNYTLDPRLFAERAAIHQQAVPKGFPIVQGIGVRSGQGGMRIPAELAVQIALARRLGAAGFNCFCYTPEHTAALFAPIKAWLEREDAK